MFDDNTPSILASDGRTEPNQDALIDAYSERCRDSGR